MLPMNVSPRNMAIPFRGCRVGKVCLVVFATIALSVVLLWLKVDKRSAALSGNSHIPPDVDYMHSVAVNVSTGSSPDTILEAHKSNSTQKSKENHSPNFHDMTPLERSQVDLRIKSVQQVSLLCVLSFRKSKWLSFVRIAVS